jgi:hypothetical protein
MRYSSGTSLSPGSKGRKPVRVETSKSAEARVDVLGALVVLAFALAAVRKARGSEADGEVEEDEDEEGNEGGRARKWFEGSWRGLGLVA